MNSYQQQGEHRHQKVFIDLSGHTFRFRWTVQDLDVFLVQSNSSLAVKGLKHRYIVWRFYTRSKM